MTKLAALQTNLGRPSLSLPTTLPMEIIFFK